MIEEGSAAWESMSVSDRAKRKRAAEEKNTKLRSPNFSVSRTRLSVRNLPFTMQEQELKQLFIGAVGPQCLYTQHLYAFAACISHLPTMWQCTIKRCFSSIHAVLLCQSSSLKPCVGSVLEALSEMPTDVHRCAHVACVYAVPLTLKNLKKLVCLWYACLQG